MSLDPRTVEWMHARIDGTISEKDDAELTGLLNHDPGARVRFEELRQLAVRLDRLEPVSPPAELREGVLAGLQPPERPAARRTERTRTLLRYGYAVAAGLVLGVLAYHLAANRALQGAVVDPADIAGTMRTERIGEEPMVTGRIGLDIPRGTGSVQLFRGRDHVSLTFDIESLDTMDVLLEFDGSRIEFRELSQDAGRIGRLDMTEESIRWSQRGRQLVAVRLRLLEPGPATAELRLFRDDEQLYETVLQLPAPE
jgi:hypothetical protein